MQADPDRGRKMCKSSQEGVCTRKKEAEEEEEDWRKDSRIREEEGKGRGLVQWETGSALLLRLWLWL